MLINGSFAHNTPITMHFRPVMQLLCLCCFLSLVVITHTLFIFD